MSTLAILIGSYSYVIFFLGILGFLYKPILLVSFLFFTSSIVIIYVPRVYQLVLEIRDFKKNKMTVLSVLLFIAMVFVNGIGALGPELAFDALWYHLTLPKLYLEAHRIFYISGNLLYYSAMPKLTEMLYAVALGFQGETLAKLIHFSFGLLTCLALYKLSRKFFSPVFAMICVAIFYSNLVVAWQSITAYVDLARTFFEVMALWGFINWIETQKQKWLIESAVMLGLAISTKLLAIGSLFIFSFLIIFYSIYKKKTLKNLSTGLFFYWFIGLLIPLPWFVFSFVHTGNPVHPFFTDVYKTYFDFSLLNPMRLLSEMWIMFTQLADPISPIYLIFLPLVALFFKKLNLGIKIIVLYSILSIIIWYITPRTGGGRFIMPYLPAFSMVIAGIIGVIREIRVKKILIGFVVLVSLIAIIYRGVANTKYLPVIFGVESKQAFLTKNLNFGFGDFYDIDDYFKRNIKSRDRVLLYGFHNLYYVDFPFTHESWVKKEEVFTHVAVQNADIPDRFKNWDMLYKNPKTGVSVLKKGEKQWAY